MLNRDETKMKYESKLDQNQGCFSITVHFEKRLKRRH